LGTAAVSFTVAESTPESVGLGGDGDEIAAIADVEDAFGIKLDYSDASHWVTAGDAFDSLRRALPDDDRDKGDLWDQFATALSTGTGVDPAKIQRGSPLLSESRFWLRVSNSSAIVWIAMALGFILLVAVLALTQR
jgi:hypothetical protein